MSNKYQDGKTEAEVQRNLTYGSTVKSVDTYLDGDDNVRIRSLKLSLVYPTPHVIELFSDGRTKNIAVRNNPAKEEAQAEADALAETQVVEADESDSASTDEDE